MILQSLHDVVRVSFKPTYHSEGHRDKKLDYYCRHLYIHLASGEFIDISLFSDRRGKLKVEGVRS